MNQSFIIGLSFLQKISYVYKKRIKMKKILLIVSFLFSIYLPGLFSQAGTDTTIYLLTCGPGTETYSIYGHSAIRIVIPEKNTDMVYNWGLFDFNTPNFAWKFAKGRLNYMLGVETLQRFLPVYFFEKRIVYSQKINLNPKEIKELVTLVNDNLKPENINYRYDFFYDDCSTRIRDLLEKTIGKKLLYPPVDMKTNPTFREMVIKYQNPFPWLMFGIDLIMGSPGEKKAMFRDRLFLPIDLKEGLSAAVINREGKMIPLLQNPEVILDFDPPLNKKKFYSTPEFVFYLLLIFVLILSGWLKNRKIIRLIDIVIFSVFSILALLMIFFNFFTDHQQMKWNLNIIWLNPFIILYLITLIMHKTSSVWFKVVFYISLAFLILHKFLPQDFNTAFIPLVLIILIRSSARAGFDWNPFSLPSTS